jgi:cytochrome oxidase Cu insertion factor (SCO1/SenC/PrrC family)
MKKLTLMILVTIALLVLAACGAQADAEPVMEDEMMEDTAVTTTEENMDDMAHDDDMTEDDMAHDDSMADEDMADSENMDSSSEDSMMEAPAWQQIELTDARTGDTFTLADFAGQPVFVEPMATWCTNCRRQLGNVREARAQIGDDAVFIGLSLETNISDEQLAQYQSDQGFDWTFAVMTPELLQQLADAFGRSITSAPSTPHFVIRPDGSTTDLVTGIEAPDQIVQQIQAARG